MKKTIGQIYYENLVLDLRDYELEKPWEELDGTDGETQEFYERHGRRMKEALNAEAQETGK